MKVRAVKVQQWDGKWNAITPNWIVGDKADASLKERRYAERKDHAGLLKYAEREEDRATRRSREMSSHDHCHAMPGGRTAALSVREQYRSHLRPRDPGLKGVSLQVPQGKIVALLGANGAGKSTTLKTISTLLRGERGDVTKGEVQFKGERVDHLTPNELVKRGLSQVMEGRHCFGHLTIEENLLTGAYTRSLVARRIEGVAGQGLPLLPAPENAARSQAGYTSGGEQQMCAIGRALMAKPSMILLDEPSMGIAPQIVEEIFGIVKDLNSKENVSSCWPSKTPASPCATPTSATSSKTAAW
jgi:ABC-type branched-subunit amino acid transport system ATPase component